MKFYIQDDFPLNSKDIVPFYSRSLPLDMWSAEQQSQHRLGACWKCRTPEPPQNLNLNSISRDVWVCQT